MIKKGEFNIHGCFLIAIFVVGNTLIYFPKQSDIKSSILGIIIAVAISVFIYIGFSLLNKKLNNLSIKNITAKPMVFIIIAITCFFISLISSSDYISYVNLYRMPYTSRFFIAVLFMALSFYLAVQRKSVIFKIALISFIYVFLSTIILFLLSFSQLDFKSVLPLEFKETDVITSGLTLLGQSFLSVIPLLFIINTQKLKKGAGVWLMGLILGFAVLMVCTLNILLIFGPDLSNELTLPYASAMSVINFGKTFSRLEGFSYLNYFICSIIKTAVPLYVIKNLFEELFNKKATFLLIPICAFLALLSFINGLTDFLYSIFFSALLIVFEMVSFLILGVIKNKKVTP